MGIPFHADGNVLYRLSIMSVIAIENTVSLSGKIGVVRRFSDCWFLRRVLQGWWYEVMALVW